MKVQDELNLDKLQRKKNSLEYFEKYFFFNKRNYRTDHEEKSYIFQWVVHVIKLSHLPN